MGGVGNVKLEVAPRGRAMTQTTGCWTCMIVGVIFSVIVECGQSAQIGNTGKKWVRAAGNDKPEVAPREGAMKTQISSP